MVHLNFVVKKNLLKGRSHAKCSFHKKQINKGTQRNFWSDGYKFTTFIVAVLSQVYAYVQIHRIVYIKYAQFLIQELDLNKAEK